MLGDPNFTFYPTPNPNPNSSPFPNSHTPDSPAYQHGGVVMNATTNVSPILHPAIDFGVMTRPMMNIIQPVQCEVCNIICNTTGMLEKHKQGKKHLKNMQKVAGLLQKPTPSSVNVPTVGELENKKLTLLKNGASVEMLISCDLCNVICNNQDGFRAHVAGKKHAAKAVIQAANANELLDPTSASRNKPDNPFHCEICKISCTSGELLNLHLAGKKHQKKLKESEQIPIPALVTSPGKPVENAEATEGKIVISQEGKPVISQEGKPVISQEGKPVVSQEGTPIISQEGTPIISQEGTPVISLEGKPVISQEGKPFISQEGTPVVSQEGKPVVSQEGTPVISQEGKPVISREGKPVISQGGKPVSCELCGISCTSYEVLKTHISGKKHQKNLEKSEKTIGPNPAALVIKPVTGPVAEPVTEPVAEPVTEPVAEPVTEPVSAPTPEVTPLVIGPQKQDTPKEEGKSVNVSGSKKKTKRSGNHEDVERKKQKILEGGGTVDAKQAETQVQATAEET